MRQVLTMCGMGTGGQESWGDSKVTYSSEDASGVWPMSGRTVSMNE